MLVAVWHSDRGVGFAVPPRLPRFLDGDPRLRAPAICARCNPDGPVHWRTLKFRTTAAKPVPAPRPLSSPIVAYRARCKVTRKRSDRIGGLFAARANGFLGVPGRDNGITELSG